MASSPITLVIFCCSLLLFTYPCAGKASVFRPKALVLPVSKDPSTLQYLTQISQRTPLVPLKLTLDVGGEFLWVDCEDPEGYVSSSYKFPHCGSVECELAYAVNCVTAGCIFIAPRPGCHNNSCVPLPENTITRVVASGELGQDVVSIQSTDGSNPGRFVKVRNFLFSCGTKLIAEGLANGVKGMAGLGWTNISLPPQFSSVFGFDKKFAICLSSSTNAKGVVFFGNGPYVLLPNIDVSESLIYTPLIFNPVSTASVYYSGSHSSDYFIGVKSININGQSVSLNTTLLSIDNEGKGGTKISTVHPYTVMETSIYKAFISDFIDQIADDIPRVAPVAPFGACLNSTKIGSTPAGPAVPLIDLVLQQDSIYWRIHGANSMVRVKRDVLCLSFVDGGVRPTTSIVIGGHQLEDNLLQFDFEHAAPRLGFSSSLLFKETTCANFNFTSKA